MSFYEDTKHYIDGTYTDKNDNAVYLSNRAKALYSEYDLKADDLKPCLDSEYIRNIYDEWDSKRKHMPDFCNVV